MLATEGVDDHPLELARRSFQRFASPFQGTHDAIEFLEVGLEAPRLTSEVAPVTLVQELVFTYGRQLSKGVAADGHPCLGVGRAVKEPSTKLHGREAPITQLTGTPGTS